MRRSTEMSELSSSPDWRTAHWNALVTCSTLVRLRPMSAGEMAPRSATHTKVEAMSSTKHSQSSRMPSHLFVEINAK